MALTEFSIIKNYFQRQKDQFPHVVVGIGDDAAVIEIPKEKQVLLSVDTLVEGVHFPIKMPARELGYKALAVSLSDVASMGATPNTALLALTMQKADRNWLKAFTDGFFSLADRYHVPLIGGDITQGPLCISVMVTGLIPKDAMICRSGAKVSDLIYVTGTLGDAGLALALSNQQNGEIDPFLLSRLHHPVPRVESGIALLGIANAAIDVSDGLVADLEKIIIASHVGAQIVVDHLPLSESLKQTCDLEKAWEYALTSGDDYELCFTVPHKKSQQLEKVFNQLEVDCHCIGEITQGDAVVMTNLQGHSLQIIKKGYEHFSKK